MATDGAGLSDEVIVEHTPAKPAEPKPAEPEPAKDE